MALWIRVDEAAELAVVTTNVAPANGVRFTLEELQRYVGGYIEALPMRDGTIMWLNEEGKLNGLPYNPVADLMAHEGTGIAWSDGIVGNVLVASAAECSDAEDDDDD